jgi:hypothetical protein
MKTQKQVALKPLDQKALKQVAGGARTTKATCDAAGMTWSKDSGTAKDGMGQCKA